MIPVGATTSDPFIWAFFVSSARRLLKCLLKALRGGRTKVLEGKWEPTRMVLLKFASYERALEWWRSEEYAPARNLRQDITLMDMILVEGL